MGYIFDDEDNAPMCDNCIDYSQVYGACMKEWKHLDPAYYIPDRDGREPDDVCEDWRKEQ